MNEFLKALDTLARESGGGGGVNLKTLEPQGIRAVALFLEDGRVVLVNCGGAAHD